jgi:hypothetical protein
MINPVLIILALSCIPLAGAYYVRKYQKPDLLIGLYVSFVLISNIVAVKIASFDFGVFTFYAPAAIIIFSVTFLLTDIVNERFGRKETQRMIFIAFVSQVAISLILFTAVKLQPAPFWTVQASFEIIFNQVPRIMIASWIAFLVSENSDAYIFSYFKKKTKGKHLWFRNAISSLPAMAIDALIFVIIAFYGVQPVIPLMIGNIAIKWIVCVIDIPFMYISRWIIKRKTL